MSCARCSPRGPKRSAGPSVARLKPVRLFLGSFDLLGDQTVIISESQKPCLTWHYVVWSWGESNPRPSRCEQVSRGSGTFGDIHKLAAQSRYDLKSCPAAFAGIRRDRLFFR